MIDPGNLSRRRFLAGTAATAAGFALAGAARAEEEPQPKQPIEPDVPPLKIALVGCGGRGTGAAENCLVSAPNIELVAMADLYQDRLDSSLKYLMSRKKLGVSVDEEKRFIGFDAYKRVLETDADLVLFATPPGFRPLHTECAIEAGKHVFIEKPVAVDPVGVRRIIAAGEKAKEKGLAIVSGTQYRHAQQFMDTVKEIHAGRIGEIIAGRAYYLTGLLWHRGESPDKTQVGYQIRNWLYYDWLAGDHLVEQHIHTVDVTDWVMGARPVRAVGLGGRLNRTDTKKWGNIYDHFAVDYEYPGGKHVTSVCRQMDRCHNHVSATFTGTKGWGNPYWGKIEGEDPWQYKGKAPRGMYVQEHTNLVESIRANEPLNEARQVAESTLTAIMGREAAYTGKSITWDEMMKSDLSLSEDVFEFGDKAMNPVPRPGQKRL